MVKILFCDDPLSPHKPDAMFQKEAQAAQQVGLGFDLVSYEALMGGDVLGAVRRVQPQQDDELAVYRGWMLTPAQYTALYDALLERGVRLVNDAAAYRHCHYLPESYTTIQSLTPKTRWMTFEGELPLERVMTLLADFGDAPLIVKDFVKSQKHYWHEACYIPSAADHATVERVSRRFLELQGDSLNEGLVYREFVALDPLSTHSKSGMPLTKEFRVFVLDGVVMFVTNYWDEGDYAGVEPPLPLFREVLGRVKSRFFTMDVAKQHDGDWIIVELGDAQVSGLPESADLTTFYTRLSQLV